MAKGGRLRRAFETYRQWYGVSPIEPTLLELPPLAADGLSAVQAFGAMENGQAANACDDPVSLAEALHGKASLNLQIRMWAEGCARRETWIDELIADFAWLPRWVWDAVTRQADKIAGWVSPGRYRSMKVEDYLSVEDIALLERRLNNVALERKTPTGATDEHLYLLGWDRKVDMGAKSVAIVIRGDVGDAVVRAFGSMKELLEAT